MPPCRVDDVVLNGQVLEEEFAREIAVGLDAADFGGRQEDVFWSFAGKEGFDRLGITEVDLPGTLTDDVPVSPPLQAPPDGASGQAVVSGYVDF